MPLRAPVHRSQNKDKFHFPEDNWMLHGGKTAQLLCWSSTAGIGDSHLGMQEGPSASQPRGTLGASSLCATAAVLHAVEGRLVKLGGPSPAVALLSAAFARRMRSFQRDRFVVTGGVAGSSQRSGSS